jgi:3-oxoadipate enol-lactonase
MGNTLLGGDRCLDVSGARLRYRDAGRGEAVVLIHGWTLDLDMWEPQVRALAQRFRVVSFDRRGFGLSSGHPGLAADAADVRALCQHLGIARAAFLGMSQSARVLERIISAEPQLVSALVFDGAPDMSPDGRLTSNDVPLADYAALVRAEGMEAFRKAWAAHPLARLVTTDSRMHELVKRMIARYPGKDLGNGADAAGSDPEPAPATVDLASIRVPVLVLNGELDLETRRRAGDQLASLIPAAQRALIPRAGHLSNLDNSITYNDTLLRFLGR